MKKTVRKNSRSDVQMSIEEDVIKGFEQKMNLHDLKCEAYLPFPGDASAKIRPDIYSEEHRIIGEVYSHLGKLKSAQMHKVQADILKMILYKDDSGIDFHMYYLVCDDGAADSIRNNSVIKIALRREDFTLVVVPIDDEQRALLSSTMKKQDLTIKTEE